MPVTPPATRRRRRLGAALALALALGAAAVAFRRPLFLGNFGAVDPGRVYRSAQPGADLPRTIDRLGLATILDLRGGSFADPWYAAEVRAAADRGVAFYDLPLSDNRRPTRAELLALIDLLRRCDYPLLIHCKAGADRTGLVSGLYLLAVRGVPPARALDAFSLSYGHFPFGRHLHLHAPFLEYAAWLEDRGLSHSPDLLRSWVFHDYEAPDPPREPRTVLPGPRFLVEAEGQGW